MKIRSGLIYAAVFGLGCTLAFAEQVLDTRRQTLNAAGVTSAVLETGSGSLTVTGNRSATTIEVHAEFRGDARDAQEARKILDKLRFSVEVRGSTFYLKADNGDRGNGWNFDWSGGNHGWIDVTLTLPSGMNLDVSDGSGSMSVAGVDGTVRIEDGSGDIEVRDLGGSLRVDDGSGGIDIRDVRGGVDITDGSGSIDMVRVGGDVMIRDGSGGIDVADVGGRFEVPNKGSGSINHRGVRGEIRIPTRKHRRG